MDATSRQNSVYDGKIQEDYFFVGIFIFNKFVWFAYMDRPRVGGVRLVDWCTCQPTHRALKTRSCSGLHTWIVHVWEVFN